MRKICFYLGALLLLNSCATLINSKTTKVKIYAPKGTVITYKDSSQKVTEEKVAIYPKRSKDSLRFSLENDSISSHFSLAKRTSGSLALNFFVPYTFGAGFLVDLTNPKRFSYKRNLRFTIDSTSNSFYRPNGQPIVLKKNDVFIYTTPLKAMDVFSQPMLTIGAEYFFKDKLSVSAEYGTVYTKRLGRKPNREIVKNKGRSFRYELKLYNTLNKSNNPRFNKYIGIEAIFMRYQFNDYIDYRVSNEDIGYSVRESFGVHKNVDIYNLKYGINYPIGKRFFIDLYSGLGVRIRQIENLNNTFNPETDTITNQDDCYLCFRRNKEQDSGTLLNFTLGFKFGYKF